MTKTLEIFRVNRNLRLNLWFIQNINNHDRRYFFVIEIICIFRYRFSNFDFQFCLALSYSISFWSDSIFFSNSYLSLLSYMFSAYKLSKSVSAGSPKLFFMKSITLFGRSCSSYRPTNTFVSWSITPFFSKYLRNSSFFYSVVCTDIFILFFY